MSQKVSVIMPCYNHARYVHASIVSILSQSYGDLELFVTNDNSSDESAQIIDDLAGADRRVIAIHHEANKGEAASRNEALERCRGSFIAFCDSDDIWYPEKIQAQIELLEGSDEFDVVHSDSVIIDENTEPTGQRFSELYQKDRKLNGDLFRDLCIANFINVPTVMIRRSCLQAAGSFDEGFRYLTDWLFWVRVARRHRFKYLKTPHVGYRIHSGSTNHDKMGYGACRIRAYDLILQNFDHDVPRRVRSIISFKKGLNHYAMGNASGASREFARAVTLSPWAFWQHTWSSLRDADYGSPALS